MDLGNAIRKRRLEMGLSQDELATALGYKSRSSITKIESGRNALPHAKITKLARALDTTPEALLFKYHQHGAQSAETATEQSEIRSGTRKAVALILAGGKSSRSLQNVPNQFANLLGRPVITYCLEVYQNHPMIESIYVACLKGWEDILQAYVEQFSITKLAGIVPGGASGVLSARNGVERILADYCPQDIIVLQESTRPLVTEEDISKVLLACNEKGAAIIGEHMGSHLQVLVQDDGSADLLNRERVFSLQSPEAHRLSILQEAFSLAGNDENLLDRSCCAAMIQEMGHNLSLCECGHNNHKIIRQEDVATLSFLTKQRGALS